MNRKDCPSKEVFVRAFMGELSESEREDFSLHVDRCPACKLQLAALTRLQDELEDRREAVPGSALSEKEVTEFKKWATDQYKALEIRDRKAFWPRVRLGAALAGGFFLILFGYYLLSRSPASHRGVRGGAAPELRLLKPGEKLKEAPVLFAWSEVGGVDHYDFTLIDNALNPLSHLGTHRPELRLPEEDRRKLTRGIPYLWTVKAIDDNDRVICSATRHFEIE